jgi:hypothetical protein
MGRERDLPLWMKRSARGFDYISISTAELAPALNETKRHRVLAFGPM